MIASRARLLIATFWVGSLWTIGYVVAPTLFATLVDSVLAGTIAGNLFRVEAWLSIASAAILIALLLPVQFDQRGKIRLLQLIGTMCVCTVIGYFVLHPFMASLRAAAGPSGVMESHAKTQFAILHGVSSLLYLVESLLGVLVILKLRA
jgi:hypothetical protein